MAPLQSPATFTFRISSGGANLNLRTVRFFYATSIVGASNRIVSPQGISCKDYEDIGTLSRKGHVEFTGPTKGKKIRAILRSEDRSGNATRCLERLSGTPPLRLAHNEKLTSVPVIPSPGGDKTTDGGYRSI